MIAIDTDFFCINVEILNLLWDLYFVEIIIYKDKVLLNSGDSESSKGDRTFGIIIPKVFNKIIYQSMFYFPFVLSPTQALIYNDNQGS